MSKILKNRPLTPKNEWKSRGYTDQDFPPGIPAGRPEGTSFETSDRGSRSYVNRDLSAESMQYALVSYYGAVEMFTALNLRLHPLLGPIMYFEV